MADSGRPRLSGQRPHSPVTGTGASAAPRGDSAEADPLPRSVAAIFRSVREAQHLSQDQVAAMTADMPGRVSRATISAIECGRSLPGLETLVSLSRVLHIDPASALGSSQ